MDQRDSYEQVRNRACRLCMEAGCPEGRDEEFWHTAAEIENAQTQMKEPALRTPGPEFP
jgi:hypothetical protein